MRGPGEVGPLYSRVSEVVTRNKLAVEAHNERTRDERLARFEEVNATEQAVIATLEDERRTALERVASSDTNGVDPTVASSIADLEERVVFLSSAAFDAAKTLK
jgi:hypothetical protein